MSTLQCCIAKRSRTRAQLGTRQKDALSLQHSTTLAAWSPFMSQHVFKA